MAERGWITFFDGGSPANGTYEKDRIAGLKDIGCNPNNHAPTHDAFKHLVIKARMHQEHRASLEKWTNG